MSLEKTKFDEIIDLLVTAYKHSAKEHLKADYREIPFNQEFNIEELFGNYFNALMTIYNVSDRNELPAIYSDVCNNNNRIEQSHMADWSSSRKLLIGLRPLNLNAVVYRLNKDFSETHQLPNRYNIREHQSMMLMFLLSDQPTLTHQLMVLLINNANKFLIAMMILCAVLSAIVSLWFLIPTTVAVFGFFSQLKKPGHREKYVQRAIDDATKRGLNVFQIFTEGNQAENMLASFY